MLKKGQRLWYIHKDTKEVKWIAVERVMPNGFEIRIDGKRYMLSYDMIGTRLFEDLRQLPVPKITAKRSSPPIIKTRPVYKLQYTRKKTRKKPELPVQPDAPVNLPDPKRTPSCAICFLRKNGTCGRLSDQLCEDYRPTQYIPDSERGNFPKYGDATKYRRRGRKQ